MLGGLALLIAAIFDVPSLNDTGLIGRTYDLADLTVRHLRRELAVEGGADADAGQQTLDFDDPDE